MSCNRQADSWRSSSWLRAVLANGAGLFLLLAIIAIGSSSQAAAAAAGLSEALVQPAAELQEEESYTCKLLRALGLPCDSDSSDSDGGGA